MKIHTSKIFLVLTSLLLVFIFYALPALARNYNYDILAKAQSLQFEGTFTVERDGATMDVSTLKPGDEIVSYSDTAAYDFPEYNPGECKQFVNIILYEVAGNNNLPNNACINGACGGGGYYENFSKNIADVVPGDILHCQYNSTIWHTMVALASPELDANGNPYRIYVLDCNWTSHYTVATRYHDLIKYPAYGYSKGWEYSLSYLDQSNDKSLEDPITLAPGETVAVTVRWKNEGREPWSNDPASPSNIYLAVVTDTVDPTSPPPARHSTLASGWLDADWKVCYPNEAEILTGQTATFEFQLQAPVSPGIYTEYFYPYHVSGGWLPDQETTFPGMHVTIIVQDDQVIDIGQGAPTEDIRLAFANAHTADLGSATGTVQAAVSFLGTSGYYQSFRYGSIQYLGDGPHADQAFTLYGRLYEKWQTLGYAASDLGFPIGNRVSAVSSFGTSGVYQLFEGGSLQLNGIDPYVVYGDIYTKWGALGYADGVLGFPLSDRLTTTSGFGTTGEYQRFEGGSIQLTGAETYAVYGEIYTAWGDAGYATWTGLPLSDVYPDGDDQRQDFEGGYITSNGTVAAFVSTTHPVNLTAEEQPDHSVALTWENRIAATGIKVYRHASPTECIGVLGPDESSFVDTTRVDDHTCTYFVQAYNETAESISSNEVVVGYCVATSQVAAGNYHTVGLRSDGMVVAVGSNYSGTCDVGGWTDITQVAAGGYHTFGIKSNGTVVSVGSNAGGECNVSGWTDIIQVAAGESHTVGLRSDGMVVAVGGNYFGQSDVSGWMDIIQVAAGDRHTVGLRSNGTVVSVGNNASGQCYVGGWTDIIQVAAGDSHTVGLRSNGTVVARGNDGNGECNVSGWTNIIQVAAGSYHTVGLRSDGTVVAVGSNIHDPCNVSGWANIIQVAAGSSHTVGLRSDGTVVAVGRNIDDQYNVAPLNNMVGIISGVVTDYSTGMPLSYAQISAGQSTTQSHADGSYAFFVTTDIHAVVYGKTDYQPITISDVNVIENKEITISAYLSPIGYVGYLNILNTELPPAEIGVDYDTRVNIGGGTYPYTFFIVYGTLPPGLTLGPDFGTIRGIPTTAGSYPFAVAVQDSQGSYAELGFTIEVTEALAVVTTNLARGTLGEPYLDSIESSGGTLPHTFTKISGTLPSGLSLSTTGNLTGIPPRTGTFVLTVLATDASGRTAEKTFNLAVDAPLAITTSRLNDGVAGQYFNQTLAASGGYGAYHWSLYNGTLPSGLLLNEITGVISGSPIEATNRSIVLAVSDEAGRVTYQDFSLHISPELVIQTSVLPTALINTPFSEAIRTAGGIAPYNFTYEGQLPAGLSLNSSTGIISGTPTLGGYTNIGITVTDSSWPMPQVATQVMGIRVSSMLTIVTSAVLPNSRIGTVMNPVILGAGGGPSPFSWAVVGGHLPAGIALDAATGEISGTPLEAGDFSFTAQVTDDNGATSMKEFFWHVSATLMIDTTVIPNGAQDEFYSTTLAAHGGLKPYFWRVTSGTLPSGLSFNNETGTVSGKPTTRQAYSFTVEVSDNDSPAQTHTRTYEIEIFDNLYIRTPSLSNGREDEAYTTTIEARQGVPPYTWQVSAGNLPPGVSLSSSETTASLDGTPTTPGTYNFTLEVRDSGEPQNRATKEYSVEIYGDIVIITEDLRNALRGQSYSDAISVSGGVAPYHWQLLSGSLPTGLSLNAATGTIDGTTYLDEGTSSSFTIRVTDSGEPSQYADREFTIQVISALVMDSTIPPAQYDEAYEYVLAGSGGISPLSWSLISGTLPDGITFDPDTGILAGTPAACGDYSFIIRLTDSSPVPESVQTMLQLAVDCSNLPVIENFEDGNNSGICWYSSGDAFWTFSNYNPYNGLKAAESPPLSDNQASSLVASVLCDDGPIRFWYAVDSETNNDFLKFYIDGELLGAWSGSVPYSLFSSVISAGRHTLTWEYSKDYSVSTGADMAWVDDICLSLHPKMDNIIDFNGDKVHDIALYVPAVNKWYTKDQATRTYGTADCIPISGDYNGDGRTDLAIVDCTRPDGLAKWYIRDQAVFIYGRADWIPVPGDYDGDGVKDFALFDPDTGKWYVRGKFIATYGQGGIPVPGDYNGDYVTDLAVFYPDTNKWYIKDVATYTYGIEGCIPIPADYDGDGATDLAVIDTSRPDGMAKWYIRNQSVFIYGAVANTIPVPGDYDGDGDVDPCLFYQDYGKWYCRNVGVWTYGNGDMIPLAANLATRYAISQEEGGSAVW